MQQLPASEMAQWEAYDRLFEIGPEATNTLLARLCAMVASYLTAKPVECTAFFGWDDAPAAAPPDDDDDEA